MLTDNSKIKSLFHPVHFFLQFLSSDFKFSRIVTDHIYLCYFSFEEKIEKAIKAAVKETQGRIHQTYLLKLVFLMPGKKSVQHRIWKWCSELAPFPEDWALLDWVRTAESSLVLRIFLSPVPSGLGPTVQQQKQRLRQCAHLAMIKGRNI